MRGIEDTSVLGVGLQSGVGQLGVGYLGVRGESLDTDQLSLDLRFAADKTLTARKGPTPVFVRASGATQVGASGLIEYAPENLILRSQESSFWGITGSASKISTDSSVAPDGTMTADVVGFSGASGYLTSTVTSVASPVSVTISCWVRVASETALFRLQIVDAPSPNFTATTTWQRFSHTGSLTSSYSGIRAASDGSSSTLEVWGLQVERSSTARTYIPTTTAAVYGARFDHDPVTLVCKGLLIEESRTNQILQSENFGTTWALTNATASLNVATAPDGSANADKIINTSGGVQGRAQQNFTLSGSNVYSVFAKAAEWGWVHIAPLQTTGGVWFNLINGTIGTQQAGFVGSITSFGNGWYRCAVQCTGLSTPLTARIHPTNADAVFTLGDGTSGILLWGAQLEAGAFPTSYIPTTTASLARSADVCSITAGAFSGFWNNSEGTVFASGDPRSTSSIATYLMANSGSNANQVAVFRNPTTNSYGVANSGSYTANISVSAANGSFNKIAGSYITNDARVAFNNVLGTPDTSVIVPTNLTRLNIGSSGIAGSEFTNGCISEIRYYKKSLSNAKLQALTT